MAKIRFFVSRFCVITLMVASLWLAGWDVLCQAAEKSAGVDVAVAGAVTPDPPSFELIPVVEVKQSSRMEVQLLFTNTSSKPVGYWKDWPYMSFDWHWKLMDPKTGKQIRERAMSSVKAPTKINVQLLASGESVLCKINLRNEIGKVPAGIYEFRLYYSIGKDYDLAELGCVPAQWDRTIMLVKVVDTDDRASFRKKPAEAIQLSKKKKNTVNLDEYPRSNDFPLTVTPVVGRRVELCCTNTSSKPIEYWKGWSDANWTPWNWQLSDPKTQKSIAKRNPVSSYVPPKDKMQTLAPGESILGKINLCNRLHEIPAGFYVLRDNYSVQKDDTFAKQRFTPGEWGRTIAMVEVLDKKRIAEQEYISLGKKTYRNLLVSKDYEIIKDIDHPGKPKDFPLEFLPVVQVDPSSNMEIQMQVTNPSFKPVGYWKNWLYENPAWHWQLVDTKTGKPVAKKREAEVSTPAEEAVQRLLPGKVVYCKIDLRKVFGEIRPGRYEFRIVYSVDENDQLAKLGCMSGKFDRTILLVDVIDKKKQAAADKTPSDKVVVSNEGSLTASTMEHVKPVDFPLQFTPFVSVKASSDMPVRFYVVNHSSKPVECLKHWLDLTSILYWELIDPRTAKPRTGKYTHRFSSIDEENATRPLTPGESVFCKICLRKRYLDIPTGRYELQVRYSMGTPFFLGLEPARFEYTPMVVDVVDGN